MSIFHEPWWLNAVAEGTWREVTVSDGGGIRARMPYLPVDGPLGLQRLLMPPLTPRLGPKLWLRESKMSRRMEEHKGLLLGLAEQLPRHDQFLQNFHASSSYWLPLSWRGYTQTTYYSYTLESLSDLGAIRSGLSKGVRSDVSKARKRFEIDADGSAVEMYELAAQSLSRANKRVPFAIGALERVYASVQRRGCGAILLARDNEGIAQAGAFVAWDSDCAYYLLGGVRPDARQSGAASFVLWEAIQLAAAHARMFDFEGSRIESIENYFRSFGGRPVPYSAVEHCSRRMLLAKALKQMRV